MTQWSKIVGLAQHYCDPDVASYPKPLFNQETFKRSLEFNNFNSSARKCSNTPAISRGYPDWL